MKTMGNVISAIGFLGFLVGACGYDSNPAAGFLTGMIGLLFTWTGYQMRKKQRR